MIIDCFYGKFAFLSNYYDSPCEFEGIIYPTVEHAFQAAKTLNQLERQEIAAAPTPGQAKRMGRSVQLREDWELVKTDVMRKCLKSKFSNPVLKTQLLATKDAILIEGTTWHDRCWGICTCSECQGAGENRLGKLLMELREELR